MASLRHIAGVSSPNLSKEIVMDDATEVEIVDLGEAKEMTKGSFMPPLSEDNPTAPWQHF